MATVRSFVAILLDETLRLALAEEIERLRRLCRAPVGWVAPENLHLTLKFLGGVPEATLERVAAALGEIAAARAPFDLAVRGLGAFPSTTRARVIWVGAGEGEPALAELAGAIDTALAALGFPREARPYSAHTTLGRLREPRHDPALAAALETRGTREFGRLGVERLSLMRSDLSPRGARYSELAGWALAPRSRA